MPVKEIRSSSALERAAYNPQTRCLSIWFKGGRRYVYSDVPAELYRELCDALSPGSFVNAAVKGRYPCRPEPARRQYPA